MLYPVYMLCQFFGGNNSYDTWRTINDMKTMTMRLRHDDERQTTKITLTRLHYWLSVAILDGNSMFASYERTDSEDSLPVESEDEVER